MSAAQEQMRRRLVRRPGLFRRWELKDVLGLSPGLHFEEDGTLTDGTALFAVYDVVNAPPVTEAAPPMTDWIGLPGVHRASEFHLADYSGDWQLEEAGRDSGGEKLYRIHHRIRGLAPAASASGPGNDQ